MVSKLGHCLNDLLFRWKAGSLPMDLVGIVSNHEDFNASPRPAATSRRRCSPAR